MRKIAQNIWVVEQPLGYFGQAYQQRMTVFRLPNNELALLSPMQIEDDQLESLDRLGKVAYMIVPNLSPNYPNAISSLKTKYANALVYAQSDWQSKRDKMLIDYPLEDTRHHFAQTLEYRLFEGHSIFVPRHSIPLKEYVFFHCQSQTIFLTDFAFYFKHPYSLLHERVREDKSRDESVVSIFAELEKNAIKASLSSLLTWNFTRAVVDYGQIVENNAKQKLKSRYESLLGEEL